MKFRAYLSVLLTVAFLLPDAVSAQETASSVNSRLRQLGARWTARESKASRLSEKEKTTRLLPPGLFASLQTSVQPLQPPPPKRDALPATLDWRNKDGKNYVTSVRDQGNFGSCWAMASTAAIESYLLRIDGSLEADSLDLSEQVLISCGQVSTMSQAFDFLSETGLPDEACYPYTSGPGNCADACADRAARSRQIPSWGWFTFSSIEDWKSALFNYGPMWVVFRPQFDFFWYGGGIIDPQPDELYMHQPHAVLLTGYNDNERSFSCKNSWDTDWGEAGYFRISYDEVAAGHFGLGTALFLECSAFSLDTDSINIDQRGGDVQVNVSTTPSSFCRWHVTSDPGSQGYHFAFPDRAEGAGSDAMTINVQPNEATIPRTQQLHINDHTVTVYQAALPEHQIFLYYQGSGWGQLVIDAEWKGSHHYTICDTAGASPGAPFCSGTYKEGTVIKLIPTGFSGTQYQGISDKVPGNPFPCETVGQDDSCTFQLSGYRYLDIHFAAAQSTPTASPSATPAPVQGLILTYPNGGERLRQNKTCTIRWKNNTIKKGATYTATLLKGAKKKALIGRTTRTAKNGQSTLRWKVPRSIKSGPDYKVKITNSKCKTCFDVSDGFFAIGNAPSATPTPTPTPSTAPATATPGPTPPPASTATPAPAPQRALSISLLGLGASTLVTNQSTAQLSGLAVANEGIASIVCTNAANSAQASATPAQSWDLSLPLASGDNSITCTITDQQSESVSIESEISYHPAMAFESKFSLLPDITYLNEARSITAQVALPYSLLSQGPTVTLINASRPAGASAFPNRSMADDGHSPDEIQNDGKFATAWNFTASVAGEYCFRVRVSVSSQEYLSEKSCIYSSAHFTESEIEAATSAGEYVYTTMESLVAGGNSHIAASDAVAAALSANPDIGRAGTNEEGGVWWITRAGILGSYSVPRPGYKSGDDDPLEIHSPRAMIISPFIYNPAAGSNFGLSDDYFGVWFNEVKRRDVCNLFSSREAFINQSDPSATGVTPTTFAEVSPYGYVHISTHGDNYYNGILNSWNNEWGEDLDKSLKGSLSVVTLNTGTYLQKVAGKWVINAYEDEIKAKRIGIRATGALELLPSYFSHHLTDMPNSLVLASACRSFRNYTLAAAFLNKGAAAFAGFTDYVDSSYAKKVTEKLISELYSDKTLKQAFDAAVAAYGANDGSNPPAEFKFVGVQDLKLFSGGIRNADFESGVPGPWQRISAGSVTSSSTFPNPAGAALGNYVGMVSTGTSAHAGYLLQNACIPANAQALNFEWSLLSEEFRENCYANDVFLVTLCQLDNRTGLHSGDCSISGMTFSITTADLCDSESLTLVDPFSSGSINDVWQSPWIGSGNISLLPYLGKSVELMVWGLDYQNPDGQTVALVDNFTITP